MEALGQCGPFVQGTCRTCNKREGPRDVTLELSQLALALDGGMPPPDLSFAEWTALGAIRRRQRAF